MAKSRVSGLARWGAFVVLLLALVLALAGRVDLPMLWAYAAVLSATALAANLVLDPGLLQERLRPAPGGVDRRRPRAIGMLFVLHLVVGVLDTARFHWSSGLPLSARLAGLGLLAAGFALVITAAAVNRFFSPVVRIQVERGHRLVQEGPYRVVRHPGYLGMCLAFIGSALALGSWTSLAISLAAVALILRRAALEDPYLLANLPGYDAYAQRVRYRLLPGVW